MQLGKAEMKPQGTVVKTGKSTFNLQMLAGLKLLIKKGNWVARKWDLVAMRCCSYKQDHCISFCLPLNYWTELCILPSTVPMHLAQSSKVIYLLHL